MRTRTVGAMGMHGTKSACARASFLLALAVASAVMGCAWGANAGGCDARMSAFALSPNGRSVAELWRSSAPRCPEGVPTSTAACVYQRATLTSLRGCPPERIVVASIDRPSVRITTLLTGTEISQLRWADHEHIAFVQGRGGKRLELVDIRTKAVTNALTAPASIDRYTMSPNGGRVAYVYSVAPPPLPSDWVSRRVPSGTGTASLVVPGMFHYVTQVIQTSSLTGRGQAVSGQTHSYKTRAIIRQLAWLRQRAGVTRAVVLQDADLRDTVFNSSLTDVATGGTIINRESILRFSQSPSRLLAVISVGPLKEASFVQMRLYVINPSHGVHRVAVADGVPMWGTHLWWHGNRLIWVEMANTDDPARAVSARQPFDQRLLEIDWRHDRVVRAIGWPNGNLENCQMDRRRTVAVCLAETLATSAQMVKVDLSSGRVTPLASLSNPVQRLDIGFKDLRIRNKFGRWSTSFLAVPQRKSALQRIPLAIMMYNFSRTFAKGGQWTHAYPVARLVHSGIAVLLLNFPQGIPLRTGDAPVARFDSLDDPLATLESAPAAVESAGVKVGRVMVMGWSQGGLVAAHAIEDSCRFVAAQTGDPADWNITGYAISDGWTHFDFDNTLGGPPEGRYLANYLALDPMRSGRTPNGPIMLEYIVINLPVGQYLAEWRAAGAYVEAFAYHHSAHWLNIPPEATISQARNLAWARINLLGPLSVSAATLRRLDLTVPPRNAYRCQ